jgi:hypothetical protein
MARPETCDACHRPIELGDWPYCPHGRSGLSAHPDDVPGGFWVENGFLTPRRFDSHSAHEAALDAEGLEIRAKWAGPHDRIMTNCGAYIDAGTLESARVLVSRGTRARETTRRWPRADQTVTVTDAGTFRAADIESEECEPLGPLMGRRRGDDP